MISGLLSRISSTGCSPRDLNTMYAIRNAISSNEELFTATDDGDGYVVTALKAFASQETLTVTIDGVEYVINVTDDVVSDWQDNRATANLVVSKGMSGPGVAPYIQKTVEEQGNPDVSVRYKVTFWDEGENGEHLPLSNYQLKNSYTDYSGT